MVGVARVALAADKSVEPSFERLRRYLAFAPISSEPEARVQANTCVGV